MKLKFWLMGNLVVLLTAGLVINLSNKSDPGSAAVRRPSWFLAHETELEWFAIALLIFLVAIGTFAIVQAHPTKQKRNLKRLK